MKKFSRCVLIWIIVTALSAVGGYLYENNTITPMYTSTTQLYVVPGEENEASVRASNGGLNNDFMIVFTSEVVISAAQKEAGTTENIAEYLSVSSPANSNIVEITCTNPDRVTAKKYVDAVAATAIKTTSIIPVRSIQILTKGTSGNQPVQPGLYQNTFYIAAAGSAACLVIELLVVLAMGAFITKDYSDDEMEYERRFGKYAALPEREKFKPSVETSVQSGSEQVRKAAEKQSQVTDLKDALEDFDEDYEEQFEQEIFHEAEQTAYVEAMNNVAASMETMTEELEEDQPDDITVSETIEKNGDGEIEAQVIHEEKVSEIVFEDREPAEQSTETKHLKSSAEVLGVIKK